MSPRAAWRLERMGFGAVSDYVGGISDWMAAGLPIEGRRSRDLAIGALARTDVPTCGPDATVGEVLQAMTKPWDTCFVVNDQRIVLGRLHRSDLRKADPKASVEDAMRPGPSTYRADVAADRMLDVMEQKEIRTAPVTRPDGSLIGIVLREDLARAVSAARTESASPSRRPSQLAARDR